MTYKFSPSSLSLLKDCPRCFRLQFNKRIKWSIQRFVEGIKSLFDASMQKAFEE